MLLSLRIENFALIDRLDREWSLGLNVLTGETGAGKSIILDAIDVVLGGKVNGRLLRAGSQRGLVEATFALTPMAMEWLGMQEIELLDEASVVCCREITATQSGLRSRCRVNGVLVNRQAISQLRDRLVEITAQGQTVQLLLPARQRELLDAFGGEELLQQREQVAIAYESFKVAMQALENRRNSEQERLQRLDWFKYQLQELEGANLDDPEELAQLEGERDRLSHVVELQQLSYKAYQVLYQNDREVPASADLLGEAESLLGDMANYDPQLDGILEMVRDAMTQVVEAGKQMYSYGESLESDPQRLEEVEERIRTLKQICRKYGPELADAIAHVEKLQRELAELNGDSQSLENLENHYQNCQKILTKESQKLTEYREIAAKQLEKKLIEELKPLAMDKVQFECRLAPTSESATGRDRVTYYFSANPGEDLQPLRETASGGEMSRFLLALKACFCDVEPANDNLPTKTLIFDEIDAGVSGKVAQAIAHKLHQLSQSHQVLCVTHQPLIAAMADAHFRVEKQIVDEPPERNNGKKRGKTAIETALLDLPEIRTVVRVTPLANHQTRRQELAQLAGGHSAQDAIAFAESLLAQAAARRAGK
ncbi:DNA repair protein RecN [Lusitaniella coriacea LEGE 07157]|uniref:DNA repair protein RecN n=1 Tax=Lusitaniella coriacea LEGE 07157 TaxID=945747 RepID=A0A8J7IX10_9CYAN|nr:DNA repair protein RecN [Lusitaniella coriacea]MBE9118423.1 DNA repair protein RecN [Lusitaniella coriacea LEGE 07157]